MSTLLEIGRGALMAYRGALNVTGENIANATTEGYRRRTQVTSEVGTLPATATDSTNMSNGVAVDDVIRSHDILVMTRAHNARAGSARSDAQLTVLQELETRFGTGAGTFEDQAGNLYAALNRLAASPSDMPLRRIVLEEARSTATTLASLAGTLSNFRAETVQRADLTAQEANAQLAALANINATLAGLSGEEARNPILDQRDRLLAGLSESIGARATFDSNGRATVFLGSIEGGPVVLSGTKPASLTFDSDLTMTVLRAGEEPISTRSFLGGEVAGLAEGISAIDAALSEVDTLARLMTSDMNAAHRAGLTLDGKQGGDLFSVDGWSVSGALSAQVTVSMTEGEAPASPISLVRVGEVWRATDGDGNLLGDATTTLSLKGLIVELPERATQGEKLLLRAETGAAHMRLMLNTPEALAASASTRALANTSNTGTGQLSIVANPPLANTLTLEDLPGLAPGEGLEFLTAGVAGILGRGSSEALLTAPPRPLTLSLAAQLPASAISLSKDGQSQTFTFDPMPATEADLVDALNAGPLAQFGAVARLADGEIAIETQPGSTLSAQLTDTNGTRAFAQIDAGAPAGGLAVFTREGRQVAGAPLTNAQIAELIQPKNGFATTATYHVDTLNSGYRGTQIMRFPGGGEVLSFQPSDAPLSLSAAGRSADIVPPKGADAGQVAELLNGLEPAPGLTFSARTDVVLNGFSDGPLTIALTGTDGSDVFIKADVFDGRADLLAAAFNRNAALTGVSAQVSADGTSLLLTQSSGRDLSLRLTEGAPFEASSGAPDGTIVGPSANVSTTSDPVSFTGRIDVVGAGSFSIAQEGTIHLSADDPMALGPIDRRSEAAGNRFVLTLPERAPDLTPPATWWVETGGTRVSVSGLKDGAEIASALADALAQEGISARANGSELILEGAAPVQAQAGAETLGDALWMQDLPDEDLIVVTTGGGLPRLGGVTVDRSSPAPSGVELRVLDANTRSIALFDSETGESIANGILDESGRLELGGFSIALSSGYATGDSFRLEPNTNAPGDGRNLGALSSLISNPLDRYREMIVGLGSQTRAAEGKALASGVIRDAALRSEAEAGAVDLDTEAARLLELQQAYQASAQTMQIARTIFETLLNSL